MRSNRSVKHVAIASLLVLAATVALASGVAADPEDHCNPENVESAFQAWPTGRKLWDRGLDHAGLAEGYGLCQYRLFGGDYYGDDPVCFCEDDFFFGGTTWYVSLDLPDGPSPSEARDWLNQWEFQVELDGTPLDVVGTAVKGGQHDSFGRVSWQQHAVFLQLPPGDYLSTFWDCHPDYGSCDPGGDGWWQYPDVRIRVLPHDVAHELGPPEDAHWGSVQCPED